MTNPETTSGQNYSDDLYPKWAKVSPQARKLFYETPLLYSAPLSKRVNQNNKNNELLPPSQVYLKLDCLQPSGSFKDRGMAHLLTELSNAGYRRIISSSGGNAGLAAATLARSPALSLHVTVVVPETTKPLVIAKLENELDATVIVHGKIWNDADAYARNLVDTDPTAAYVPPYEHELLWTGHSTVVDEIYVQLPSLLSVDDSSSSSPPPIAPGAIIVSVGGGGLLCGVLEGLQRHHHREDGTDTKHPKCHVIAAETCGANSFHQAFVTGHVVRLPTISSIATSLGALQVSESALSRAQDYGSVSTAVCTDAQAVQACCQFAQDHRILVEPACGAALAVIYSQLYDFSTLAGRPIVVQVCGGSGVSMELLQTWMQLQQSTEEQ